MPSNYTPNYQLNQWDADDRVLRTDFNADNAKIDAALGALASGVDGGLRLYVGSYVGAGTTSRSLDFSQTLGRPPRLLVILGTDNRVMLWEKPTSTVVTWSANFVYDAYNEEGRTYRYFALG